jgi:hypothetical protein
VPEVRRRAESLIRWRASAQPDEGFVAALGAAVEFLLQSRPPLQVLVAQLGSDDVVCAARAAAAVLASDDARAGAELLVRCQYARLRQAALYHLHSSSDLDGALIELGLADRAAGVRAVAQMASASIGLDTLAWYRAVLASDLVTGLLGLGDVGSTADVATAEAVLAATPSTSARAAAVRLIARKGGGTNVELLAAEAARGGRAGREAISALRKRRLPTEVVRGLVQSAVEKAGDDPATVRRVARSLLPLADRWVGLELGLVLAASDGDVSLLGIELLERLWQRWNRSATEPSRDQLLAISILFTNAEIRLEAARPGLCSDLRFLVKPMTSKPSIAT